MSDTVKVIVKVEGNWAEGFKPLLFFPESRTQFGKIECWDGEHSQADLSYYRGLRNPPKVQDMDYAVNRLLSQYERQYQCAGQFKLKRVFRDSHAMRTRRWK